MYLFTTKNFTSTNEEVTFDIDVTDNEIIIVVYLKDSQEIY